MDFYRAWLASGDTELKYKTLFYLHTLFVSGNDFYLPTKACLNTFRHRNQRLIIFYIDYPQRILLTGYLIESGQWNCEHCTPCHLVPELVLPHCNGVVVFVNGECVHHTNLEYGIRHG